MFVDAGQTSCVSTGHKIAQNGIMKINLLNGNAAILRKLVFFGKTFLSWDEADFGQYPNGINNRMLLLAMMAPHGF